MTNPVAVAQAVETVCVDQEAHGYATFQSHNQKVVANQHGIFMTHIRTRNEPYTAQQWRSLRSTDRGQSFTVIYEATDATNPPVLETDAAGNIYLVRPDFVDHHAHLYRFLADKAFRDPVITPIPNGGAGKFCMVLDPKREQLYYFAHNGTFHVVGLDGQVRRSIQLLAQGANAAPQYPLLSMTPDGALYAAWTSQKHGVYMYWDIHHMCSMDAGQTWRNLDGSALSVPVPADDSGPAARVTLDDEFDVHTWLANFIAKDGKLHFLYLAQTEPTRQHYMRYDAATGARDIHCQPDFKGDALQIHTFDGFFATRPGAPRPGAPRPGAPIYCVGAHEGHVVCIVSPDNGATWHDHARSEQVFNIYSLGGCREISDGGYIIGSFTDQKGSNLTTECKSQVHFFRINAPVQGDGDNPDAVGQEGIVPLRKEAAHRQRRIIVQLCTEAPAQVMLQDLLLSVPQDSA